MKQDYHLFTTSQIPFVIFLIFISFYTYSQARLNVQGNVSADTLKANAIIKKNGIAGEILLANGAVVPVSNTSGQQLTSNANAAPTWKTPSRSSQGNSPLNQAATAGSSANQHGLGVGTSQPNSLFTIDGSGYDADKIFNISSNNHVSAILNSVDDSYLGLSFANNNTNQWFAGLYPVNNNPHNLILKGPDFIDEYTVANTNVGINRNDPQFALDINGTLRANGYRFNIRKYWPPQNTTTTINVDWIDDYIFVYPTGNDLSKIIINFSNLANYNASNDAMNFTSKRIVVKIIGPLLASVANNNFGKFNFEVVNNGVSSSLYNDGVNENTKVVNFTYNQTYSFVFSRLNGQNIFCSAETFQSF